jgi:hypothetical protein
MISATCHCGAVRLELRRKPRTLTSCNCSICRRYGALWCYFRLRDVTVSGKRSLVGYSWNGRTLRLMRCAKCGCVTHWLPTGRRDRMGVNARNLEPAVIAGVRVRRLDGAKTWKFLD